MLSSLGPLLGRSKPWIGLSLSRYALRPLSSPTNQFLYLKDFKELNERVKSSNEYNEHTIKQILSACKDIQRSNYTIHDTQKDSVPYTETKRIIDHIFGNEKLNFDESLLKSLFLLKLPSSVEVYLIELYNQRNPTAIIPREIALIPLRNSIYNADFQNAVKITDLTVANKNYVAKQNEILKSGFLRLIGSSLLVTFLTKYGVQQAIDFGWVSSSWKFLGSINSMILTYLLNSSFFFTIVKFGRQLITAGGDYLTWQKGTFYTHWFRYADMMLFSTKIVEADRQLNLGESNPELMNELCRTDDPNTFDPHTLKPGLNREGEKIRLLEAKDDLEDIRLQAYWMGGGDGFEWVEPDQDPAELLWFNYLDQYNKPALNNVNNKSLNWADEIIDKNSEIDEPKHLI